MNSKVRWGILGTGKVARAFATALTDTPDAQLAGIGSRNPDSAADFARTFGGRPYGTYEELVHAADVDLVYVATPHPMHYRNVRLALEAGKGVLCEKAFTVNRREAEDLVRRARDRGLFLMEAMWTRFLPAFAEVRRIVDAGEIGAVRQAGGPAMNQAAAHSSAANPAAAIQAYRACSVMASFSGAKSLSCSSISSFAPFHSAASIFRRHDEKRSHSNFAMLTQRLRDVNR